MVAQEDDVAEAGRAQAPRRCVEDLLERRRRNRERARMAHVPGGRSDGAFGHVRDDRGHQSIAEALGDALREQAHARVVLAERDVVAVLLGSAERHEDGGRAGADARCELDGREVLEPGRSTDRRGAGRNGEHERDQQRERRCEAREKGREWTHHVAHLRRCSALRCRGR
jgi:hypothetical protein